ncbi:hypothetical protein DYB28_008911 [Aphanomyces astaci]|uniref:Uncharacterized protein n=1 Tax=Aphanomyces astaci TaxID=112090 RepID=A0A397E588_APHAT|nr:hypothetical protein DYB25_013191 [Aphanomyces astaci]RHY69451.1 hypothetical protein DYB34_013265 [Aphanomyces astaci]RHY75894.1 hypothetical protein DYB30_006430 [Aphanomyces astaci]RHZ23105.1 hypothetical protein DYB31_005179 [Aphanomyces astaci]RLO11769.1 hypothetical protein DYB28_008911 [Aphanomyces astaci]
MLRAVRQQVTKPQVPTRRRIGFTVQHTHSVNMRASSSSSLFQAASVSAATSQHATRKGVAGRVLVGLLSLGAGDFVRQVIAEERPFDTRRLAVSAAVGGLYIPLRERFGVHASSLVQSQTLRGTMTRLGLQLVVVGPVSLACFLAAHIAAKELAVVGSCLSWSSYMSFIAHKDDDQHSTPLLIDYAVTQGTVLSAS